MTGLVRLGRSTGSRQSLGAVGASGHTARASPTLASCPAPALPQPTRPFSFVSSISVRGPFHSATHTEVERASGIMPQPLVLLSFVSSISVRRQISRDKLCARCPADKGWGASHGHFGQYPATQTAASPGLYHKETMTLMLSSPGSNSHGGGH